MTEEPFKARYMRYSAPGEEEFGSLDEAVGFLAWGWEAGNLAEVEIVDPGGNVVLTGAELFDRMMARLGA